MARQYYLDKRVLRSNVTSTTGLSSVLDLNAFIQDVANDAAFSVADGTVSLPGLAFASDTDSGLYRIGSNNIGVAVNGAKVLDIATTGLGVTGALTPTGGVAAAGGFSHAPNLCHTGGIPADVSTFGSELTITNTELYVAQVFIPANCTVTGVAFMTGATTNGNVKVMLFNSAGTRVAISASTDNSGFTGDTYNRVPFTSTYAAKGPATYYVGVICDTNTNTINTHTFGDFRAGKITGLVYATEAGYASITAPTTFTTALGPVASLY